MPVFGQSTDFNDRLCSLMSAIFYNTNTIYDGGGGGSSTTRQRRVHVRPLFTKAILQKAERLNELKLLPSSSSLPLSTTTTKTIIEVILVIDKSSESHPTYTTSHDDDNNTSSSSSNSNSNRFLLSKLISQFFSLPADIYHLDVITVRSQSIQEDLIAAPSTSSFSNFGGSGGRRRRHRCRRRVWVALGSAITGLYQYLLLLEGQRLKHRLQQVESKESSSSSSSSLIDDESSSSAMILGVICIDPPLYLWKSYGKSILYQTCLKEIPSLLVVSDQDQQQQQQQQQQYDHNSNKNEEGNSYNSRQNTTSTRSSMVGEMLRDCIHHPHALVVITNDNSNGTGNNSKKNYNHLDYYVWLARLITKYTESIQRLRTPPRTPPPPLSTTWTKTTLTTTEDQFLSKL
ncbi:hypothetical protein FRACYDRAFT_244056 [Fragilariopsis cylindrus CCMP1102]|uniref:Uncharacterized protein n=1 Tax=Fragilariopsis cylindrus CCMP1102 TaxID=635003 RepID=A0A1E7F3N0_9STRA|nr:hypothetical protein FRACYDRAFT_244056 [Fragilariopsis cylindrus CCMP1102]|eukprot:OEU12782.1 hypothetical protein FRACYDRAFT_244056 [Fragilariopsis cylindrus CCMP1102]